MLCPLHVGSSGRFLTHPLSPGHQNQQSLGLALEKATWYDLVYQSCKVVPQLVELASHITSHNYMDLYGVKNYVILGWIYDMGNSKIEENRSCYKWVNINQQTWQVGALFGAVSPAIPDVYIFAGHSNYTSFERIATSAFSGLYFEAETEHSSMIRWSKCRQNSGCGFVAEGNRTLTH